MNVGSVSVGSGQYMAAALFKATTGLDFAIVPFKARRRWCPPSRAPTSRGVRDRRAGDGDGEKRRPEGARGDFKQAFSRPARGADGAGSGRGPLRRNRVERRRRAGENPAPHHRAPEPRNQRRHGPAEHRQKFQEFGIDSRGSTPEELHDLLASEIAKVDPGGGNGEESKNSSGRTSWQTQNRIPNFV